MSNFKIVCGTNPKDEIIINLEKVKQIFLCDSEIVVEDVTNQSWVFETDLKELSDVLYCFQFSLGSKVEFKKEALEFSLEVRRLGEIAKLSGKSL